VLTSQGFTDFFARIKAEIQHDYLASAGPLLDDLRFPEGVLISARLGRGNKGAGYTVRKPEEAGNWIQRLSEGGRKATPSASPTVTRTSARMLSELNSKGINLVANAAAQSAEHIGGFLEALQRELASTSVWSTCTTCWRNWGSPHACRSLSRPMSAG